MLAERALGLGTTLTTIHRFRDLQIKALLGIPLGVEAAALVPLGYPIGKFGPPPRKPVEAGRVPRPLGLGRATRQCLMRAADRRRSVALHAAARSPTRAGHRSARRRPRAHGR